MRNGVFAILTCGLVAGGCATASKSSGAMLGYTDRNLFVIEHHDPEQGGRIVGTVCAVDVQLNARLRADGVLVTGVVTDRHGSTEGIHYDSFSKAYVPSPNSSELPYRVEVHDRSAQNERALMGMIGDITGQPDERVTAPHAVDLTLTSERISGTLGARHFDLRARGDDYIGSMKLNDTSMPYVVRGRGQLWRMPAAAQASILPLLMTCSEPTKMIQLVDLRQTTQPESEAPTWVELPHAAPRPMPQIALPLPTPLPVAEPSPAAPSAPPQRRS